MTEISVRLGRVQSLQEHFQIATPHGILTKSLYDGVRGCCFSVHLQHSSKQPASLSHLVFRNFYTAALRLVQINSDGSSTVLLDEYPLMQHIHCEDDAQNWHTLQLDKLQAQIDMSTLESFFFYLFQPSPLWEKWELQHLKFYAVRPVSSADAPQQQQPPAKPISDSLGYKLRASGAPSPTSRTSAATDPRSNSLNGSASHLQGASHSAAESRLMKRPSRMALVACVESKDVQENAAQCLALVERLRALLHTSSQP